MNVVDSSGWIEFFLASKASTAFRPVIGLPSQLVVPALSLFEVHKFLSRHCDQELIETCLTLMRRGRVVDLTDARAIAASKVAQQHKLAMADAVMYTAAIEFNATFWTQDVDYKDLPNVKYLAKEKQGKEK